MVHVAISYSSIRELVILAEGALLSGRIDDALRIVHDFVEQIITEPLCTAQVFASRDLDRLCLRIGQLSFKRLGARQVDPWIGQRRGPLVVYLVSRMQNSGGHSRLLEDFIRAQPNKDHLVLSTEIGGPSDRGASGRFSSPEGNVRVLFASRGNLQSRLTWLQSVLCASTPERVYLLNHHQDSAAVAALVPELGLRGTFVHHGDHHLCLGVHMEHLTHLDLHPMGYHYCRNDLGVDNSYLPLTFENECPQPEQPEVERGKRLITATSARSNKVEIPYYVSYLDIIAQILKVTCGHHIHIGRLTPWALRRIRNELHKNGIEQDRFVYIEWVPSVWRALQENGVDVYIASFPYGAGLTLIEAMGAGIPVIMHKHMYSRVLSGLELAYQGAFAWAEPEDLLMHLGALRPEGLKHEKNLSRRQYELFHRPEVLQAYLGDPDRFSMPTPPLSADFRARYDEWAAWAERQLTIRRFVFRFAYRAWRRIRSLSLF